MTPLDVFGGAMYLLFFAPFLFPLAPWFAKRPRGAWLVCCAAVSVLVLLFPAMFWWGVTGQTAAKEPLQFSSSLQFGCSLP
ncbi:hypothetical protein V1294_004575 [Bradyrhizobium sp. AZCC 1678]|uniref:hypothetical protein n=1 Tax=Bradyrhizobium sp. AZCC 1678 TaxID=3117030 RepID=UPI002FF3568D